MSLKRVDCRLLDPDSSFQLNLREIPNISRALARNPTISWLARRLLASKMSPWIVKKSNYVRSRYLAFGLPFRVVYELHLADTRLSVLLECLGCQQIEGKRGGYWKSLANLWFSNLGVQPSRPAFLMRLKVNNDFTITERFFAHWLVESHGQWEYRPWKWLDYGAICFPLSLLSDSPQ